ncbi:hypothetical protein [Aliikangiella coralliicola]|uniref:Uncharacterized protein n=1 Tax=Aliikangiella coralliicola TaxID=2592383 RepID=A0A545UEZ1_9GAMM|nr:hypothetical protein [Aliikangiella coralliicola]TQV88046.1 hypothetical protein FLL46_09565 [Aliikangiella coralliicola]
MKLAKLFSASALLFASSSAWSGAYFNNEVDVTDTYLRGSLSSATNSSDSTQYVGCYINSYGTGATVVCLGRTASGTIKSCIDSSPNEATLNAVAGLSNSSYLYATFSDGKCTRISIHSNSAFNQ